jgi:hypothetical protein
MKTLKYIKDRITIADIITIVFLIGILAYFGPLAFGKSLPQGIPTEQGIWRLDMTEEVVLAYDKYEKALDRDSTDTGCDIAVGELEIEINSILFRYKEFLEKADREELEADRNIDAYGAGIEQNKLTRK